MQPTSDTDPGPDDAGLTQTQRWVLGGIAAALIILLAIDG